MLIRDLTIKGYRCFEDFSMDGLTRVNLLVGNNNSGKTSFLEAIYLLVNQPSMGTVEKTIREIFDNRGELSQQIETIDNEFKQVITRKYYLESFFNGYGKDKCNHLVISGKEELGDIEFSCFLGKDLLRLKYPDDISMFQPLVTIVKEIDLFFRAIGSVLKQVGNDQISSRALKAKKDFSLLISSSVFLSAYKINFNEIAKIWDQICLTYKEEIVIEAMRIINPNIDRIGFSTSPGINTIRLKLRGLSDLIPLSSMGDGMNRILTLAMALVSAEKGVLLVDEIETGLHYEAQLDMWRLVLKTAQNLNVQVFATTHSWDCIVAFKEALQELEDQSVAKLFRLDSKYGKLRAVEYDAEDIRIAVDQGIEVR
ncbi:MAG: AAA family ATPase [Snowella sp.]|nr:AAA family ATPase [Snowella sp.]